MSSTASDSQAEKFARSAAAAVGVVFLLVGILGFIPGITTDYDTMTFASHDSEAQLLGVFQVSILHNIVHVLFGIAGLVAARNARDVFRYLSITAIAYGVLTVYGIFIDKTSSANFVPVDSADNWLHLVLTAGLAVLALVVQRRLAAPASTR